MLGPIAQIKLLRTMQAKDTEFFSETDTFILRDLAYTYGGQDWVAGYGPMIEYLILRLTPLAVAERLLE